jgi:hypothetical protein
VATRPKNPRITFHLGLNTSVDPSQLQVGELVEATGCKYQPSSEHLYKLEGRSDTRDNRHGVQHGYGRTRGCGGG